MLQSPLNYKPNLPAIETQHLLFPAPMPLFPTAGTLQEVLDLGESRLPITNKNDLMSLLATYHNTLLAQTQP